MRNAGRAALIGRCAMSLPILASAVKRRTPFPVSAGVQAQARCATPPDRAQRSGRATCALGVASHPVAHQLHWAECLRPSSTRCDCATFSSSVLCSCCSSSVASPCIWRTTCFWHHCSGSDPITPPSSPQRRSALPAAQRVQIGHRWAAGVFDKLTNGHETR